MSAFSKAWQLLKERVEAKSSWGRQELKNLMFECLHEGAKEHEEKECLGGEDN